MLISLSLDALGTREEGGGFYYFRVGDGPMIVPEFAAPFGAANATAHERPRREANGERHTRSSARDRKHSFGRNYLNFPSETSTVLRQSLTFEQRAAVW